MDNSNINLNKQQNLYINLNEYNSDLFYKKHCNKKLGSFYKYSDYYNEYKHPKKDYKIILNPRQYNGHLKNNEKNIDYETNMVTRSYLRSQYVDIESYTQIGNINDIFRIAL